MGAFCMQCLFRATIATIARVMAEYFVQSNTTAAAAAAAATGQKQHFKIKHRQASTCTHDACESTYFADS